MSPRRHPIWLPALIALGLAAAAPAAERVPLRLEDFDKLREIIRPGEGEARWAQIDWMPASDIWAARKKAAAEGKPLFLWHMAGEPLGSC